MTLEEIKKDYERYGEEVLHLYELGDIQIVKYHNKEENEISYRAYIHGKKTHFIFHDLEQAIVNAIAVKHDGFGTRADGYFWKMIK